MEVQAGSVIYRPILTQLAPTSSMANTRALTIGISGIMGGPMVGVAVGGISGIVRYFQGGLDPHVYLISSLLIGLVSGLLGQVYIQKGQVPTALFGGLVAGAFELIQMAVILIASSRLDQALALVQFIILPMTVINSLGMGIFLAFIRSSQERQVMDRAVQTQDVLALANATLPHFRQGLAIESCSKAAQEIMNYIKLAAVSITDKEKILAHVGLADDHHKPGNPIMTRLSKQVLEGKEVVIAWSKAEIACGHPDCPLQAAIVVPLKTKEGVVGTLKLYFESSLDLTFVEKKVAEGLGNIFSSQIDLGKSELQARLLQDAEIKSLQAQVNPHFFFNAMNTISALVRLDSAKARQLLSQLSDFFRANLVGARSNLVTLGQELDHVKAYQSLEQARFPGRYQLDFQVDEELLPVLVPPFILQVLVENAFKHAFKGRKAGNEIKLEVKEEGDEILIAVQDNGLGMETTILKDLGQKEVKSSQSKGTGTALLNLNKRLTNLFGLDSQLKIDSSGSGTTVSCHLPKTRKEDWGLCTYWLLMMNL